MDDHCHIDEPAGQKFSEEFRKPEDQSGHSNDANSPENSHIIEFFPVGPAAILRPGTEAEKPFYRTNKILYIFFIKPERALTEDHLFPGRSGFNFSSDHRKQMGEKVSKSNDG